MENKRTWPNAPDMNELKCLNSWPVNSFGYAEEQLLIYELLSLCKKHGFGRVPQLANQIQSVWQRPELVEGFSKDRQTRLTQLSQLRE